MRYAAVVAASAAMVGTLVFARDGRSEAAPAVQAVPAVRQEQSAAPRRTVQRGQEDFRWAGRLARGQEIEIRGIVGDVRAEYTSGDQVEVVGRRSGDNAQRIQIEVVERRGGVIVCALYPPRGEDRVRRNRDNDDGDCGRADGEHGEIDMDDARVDFTVRVPAGVKFAAKVISGDVYATSLRGPVDVATVSGDVRVSTTGTARAASVSGSVDATFGETDGEEMEFATVSGDVTLRLAGGVGARVSAHTLTGDIDSDFPGLRIRPGTGDDDEDEDDHGGFHVNVRIGQQASGTIGRGGPELSVNTVSGNIHFARVR